jgi:hypothetical protein
MQLDASLPESWPASTSPLLDPPLLDPPLLDPPLLDPPLLLVPSPLLEPPLLDPPPLDDAPPLLDPPPLDVRFVFSAEQLVTSKRPTRAPARRDVSISRRGCTGRTSHHMRRGSRRRA